MAGIERVLNPCIYKIGFATLSASALLGLAPETDLAIQQHQLFKQTLSHEYIWEQPPTETYTDILDTNSVMTEQVRSLKEFVSKIFSMSQSLPPEITDLVTDHFEELLA